MSFKLCMLLLLGFSVAHATSVEEVKTFVNEGAKLCKEKGTEVCLKEFNDPQGSFIRGELYMFAYDFNGINKALGSNPKIVGKNLYNLKDGSGIMLIQKLIEVAKNQNEGWVDYVWSHPLTKKNTPKTSFIKKIDDNLFIGTGYYK